MWSIFLSKFRTRFAPSPTGLLHLGHAASARAVWDGAVRAGGEVLLRIEDIDTTRCRPDYTDAIYEDLRWLGFEWPEPVRVQSEHFSDYAKVVEALDARGLAYRCFRTRAEIAAATPEGQMFVSAPLPPVEEQRRLEVGEAFAWRLSLAACEAALGGTYHDLSFQLETKTGLETRRADPGLHGDIVIARKDSLSAYHIAATHDDALQGMTHIIRGDDLAYAPHIQTLLQVLMDWPQPIYHHHALMMGPDGKRLSKSHGSISLAGLRRSGKTPDDIWDMIGHL
ncbi:MAG: tRNA glutamyl-Q(34) synthetase GluQRS [Pseudomonadota bacterium]